MKIALVARRLPPSGLGQAVYLYRMLQCFNPETYCLISPERHDSGNSANQYLPRLPGRYYHLPPPFHFNRGSRFGLRHLREGINIPLAVRQHRQRIYDIIKREKCSSVVAITGDVAHLPAGYLASRRAGIPFHAVVHDDYSYKEWQDPAAAFWARRLQPWLMKRARNVIVPNETLRDDLRERYGVEAVVIHNSVDLSSYESNVQPRPWARDGEIKMVFTGSIYQAHYDAFRNLIAALKSMEQPRVKLHLYADRTVKDLEALGISGPVVYHSQRALSEMPRIQMEADLLFLPLAFDSPYPDLVRTAGPTKLGEYLATRRPVLVHAPPTSFVSWYFRRYQCGVVVDENDPAKVVEGIQRILHEAELREQITSNAWARAHTDFDISNARADFAKVVGLKL